MTDLPPSDLTEAERRCRVHADAMYQAGQHGLMLDVLLAEYDRRGTADVDTWRSRALTAESRVDGQAWVDLEAERDRLKRQKIHYQNAVVSLVKHVRAMYADLDTNELDTEGAIAAIRAAHPSPGAPTPASLVEQDRRVTGSLAAAYRRGWREGAGDDEYEGPIIVPDDLAAPAASSPPVKEHTDD